MTWAFFEHSDILWLYKPVSDWVETLHDRISGLNLCLLDIIEMKSNDLRLNVKGNYIFFKGKIILKLHWYNKALKLIEIQNVAITLNFG